jgi:hypothetical protein
MGKLPYIPGGRRDEGKKFSKKNVRQVQDSQAERRSASGLRKSQAQAEAGIVFNQGVGCGSAYAGPSATGTTGTPVRTDSRRIK